MRDCHLCSQSQQPAGIMVSHSLNTVLTSLPLLIYTLCIPLLSLTITWDRALPCRTADIVFFDESIRAKLNRSRFRFYSIRTPFLSDKTNRHTKTYVPPTPDTSGLPDTKETYQYDRFPKLQYVIIRCFCFLITLTFTF